MEMDSIIQSIAARVNNSPHEGDYTQDGVLYCGKCKTPREVIIDGLKLPCKCRCEMEQFEAEQERLRQMDINANLRQLKSMSLVESRYSDATFDKMKIVPENERNVKLCKRYAFAFDQMVEKNQGLLMYGGVGTGKSYAAACIANELLGKGVPVIMTSTVKIIEEIQNGAPERALLDRLDSAKLVIYDDLGAERNTSYAMERVYNVIDSRYRKRLPMIVTTNLSIDEMCSETDLTLARIYDRIFETCYPMEFKGISWRKLRASEMYRGINFE